MGLGFCIACLTTMKQAMAARETDPTVNVPVPQFAVGMAPAQIPVPGPGGQMAGMAIVALPSCFDHLAGGQPEQRRPLLVAGQMP
jgi:hypothetical protein